MHPATRAGALLAVGALLAGPGPARAAGRPPGSLSISPAVHELRLTPGGVLTPSQVSDTTTSAVRVQVIPVLLRQTSGGAFAFHAGAAARRVLAVSTRGFTLAPGDRADVLERWRPGSPRRTTAAGVLFRMVPPRGAATIHPIGQILQLDLLSLRGAAPARGRFAGMSASDRDAHRLTLDVALRNLGRSVGTPSGVHLVVRDATGRVVTRLRPRVGVIVPGATLDLAAPLPRRLPAGRYTATATGRLGAGPIAPRSLAFTTTAAGLLPAPSLHAGAIHAAATVGGRVTVTVPVRNAGSRAGRPRGTVSLYALRDGRPGPRPVAEAPLAGPLIAPGASSTERVPLGRAGRAPIEAVVRYARPFTAAPPALVDLVPRPTRSAAARAGDWVAGHGLVLALVAALALSTALALRRRRQPTPTAAGVRLRPLP